MSDGRYAGVDWASEEHAVCVVDEQGRIIEGRRYSHNEPAIRALCARLLRLRPKTRSFPMARAGLEPARDGL